MDDCYQAGQGKCKAPEPPPRSGDAPGGRGHKKKRKALNACCVARPAQSVAPSPTAIKLVAISLLLAGTGAAPPVQCDVEMRDPEDTWFSTEKRLLLVLTNDGTNHGKAVQHSLQGGTFRVLNQREGTRSSDNTTVFSLARCSETKEEMAPVLAAQREDCERMVKDGVVINKMKRDVFVHAIANDAKLRAPELHHAALPTPSRHAETCLPPLDERRRR